MSYVYKYIIPNLKFLNLLNDYITNIPELPVNFSLLSEDLVSIIFSEPLSTTQQNLLTTSIQSYSAPQFYNIIDNTQAINIIQNIIGSTDYTSIATYIWIMNDTNSNIIDLGNVVVIANLVGPEDTHIINNASYKLRLYNAINNKVIFESDNLTNTDMKILTFSNIQNIPTFDTLLELQASVSINNYKVNISAAHLTFFQTIGK